MHIALNSEFISEEFFEQGMQQRSFRIFIAFASQVLPEGF